MGEPIVLTQNKNFTLEMEKDPGGLLFRPVGTIDEDANFAVVLDALKQAGNVIGAQFDLSQISRMNSCGVREWLLLMERIPKTVTMSFFNVNECFIEQANMIPSMFGAKGSTIVSFEAPYHCSQCKQDLPIILDPKQVKFEGQEPQAPKVKCPHCGDNLEFAWLEDEYFSFLKRI